MTRICLLLTLLAMALSRLATAADNPPPKRDVPSEEQKAVIEKLNATYMDLASESSDTARLRGYLGNLFDLSCNLEALYPSTKKMWPEGLHKQLQQFIPLARKTFSLADQDVSFRAIVDAPESTSKVTLITQIKAVSQNLTPIDANIPIPQPWALLRFHRGAI